MTRTALGVYREAEFSPGKVEADRAILEAALSELRAYGFATTTIDPARFVLTPAGRFDVALAMCQGERALSQLAAFEEAGALVINPALAIRNCYRDLLSAGLKRAGVPIPHGVLVETGSGFDQRLLTGLDIAAGIYLKRGDLHALTDDDVVRVDSLEALRAALLSFGVREIKLAYIQQAVAGPLVKFYGVSGGEYFAALTDDRRFDDGLRRQLAEAAVNAAAVLGLEVWGGDAVLTDNGFVIIDFNDWPSFSRVRDQAAAAIARRAARLARRPGREASGSAGGR